jgi:bacteriocin-like protein
MRELTVDELKAVSGGCNGLCPCNYKITSGPQPKPSPAHH